MMKIKVFCFFVIGLFLTISSACQQGVGTTADGDNQITNEKIDTIGAAGTSEANSATSENKSLTDGVSVPAKREKMSATDRAAFLQALGLTELAENSTQFVEYMTGPTGVGSFSNAGMKFFSLGGDKYLVEIMIDQGARLSTSVYALYQEISPDKALAKKLELDSYYRKDGKVVKTSSFEKVGAPKFDERTKTFTIAAAARGYGGCGDYTKYKIVGDRAETIEARYQECTDSDDISPPEEWELIPLTKAQDGKSTANKDQAKLPVEKSPGIAVCAEGYGGNGLEIREADFRHMQPAHAAVLKRWLCYQTSNMRPEWNDKNSSSSQKYFRQDNPKSHPFYVTGDFNKNGVDDFAVILDYFVPIVSRVTKRELNALAIFEMSPKKTGSKPVAALFADKMDSLFIIGKFEDGRLWTGSYPSDDGGVFVPKGETYTVKAMID